MMRALPPVLAMLALAGCAAPEGGGILRPPPGATLVSAHLDFEDEVGPLPVERYAPPYPAQNIADAAEGRCRITFDILPDGTTANHCAACEAVSARSTRVAEQRFLESSAVLRQWRYPQSAEGFPGAATVLVYRLDEGRDEIPAAPAAISCAEAPAE